MSDKRHVGLLSSTPPLEFSEDIKPFFMLLKVFCLFVCVFIFFNECLMRREEGRVEMNFTNRQK